MKSTSSNSGQHTSKTPSNQKDNWEYFEHGKLPPANISAKIEERGDFYYLKDDEVNNGVPFPKKAFDENGELDLRKLKGEDAARYIRGLGINLAIIPRGRR